MYKTTNYTNHLFKDTYQRGLCLLCPFAHVDNEERERERERESVCDREREKEREVRLKRALKAKKER